MLVLLRGGVGVDAKLTDLDGALDNHGAVGLINDAIDLLKVVRVREDLVVRDNVLFRECGVSPQSPSLLRQRPDWAVRETPSACNSP